LISLALKPLALAISPSIFSLILRQT